MYPNDPGTYDARTIANFFLRIAAAEKRTIDPLGIQKFVFLAHGWNLALYNRPLITQRVEAWDYGPVIVDLYDAFKSYGNGPILSFASEPMPGPQGVRIDAQTEALLRRVWDVHKGFSSVQLSNLTHEPNSPWTHARRDHRKVIDDELIKTYFESLEPAA